jgi:hypothetical protein
MRVCKKASSKVVIDLTGPQGNCFFLLGQAQRFACQLGLDSDTILNEMKGGNYEHLVSTFDKYFGDYVILEE